MASKNDWVAFRAETQDLTNIINNLVALVRDAQPKFSQTSSREVQIAGLCHIVQDLFGGMYEDDGDLANEMIVLAATAILLLSDTPYPVDIPLAVRDESRKSVKDLVARMLAREAASRGGPDR